MAIGISGALFVTVIVFVLARIYPETDDEVNDPRLLRAYWAVLFGPPSIAKANAREQIEEITTGSLTEPLLGASA